MLITEYGSVEHLPCHISGPVLEIEEIYITENSRHKYKFLDHLPLATKVLFLEIDMQNLVSENTF
jgi:hypothetical protein